MNMKKQIILPILDEKSNRYSKFIVRLFICGLVGVFLNIFFLNSIFMYCLTIGVVIFSGIIMGVLNIHERTGTLILTELDININNKEIISIKDVRDLKMILGGYEGKKGLYNLRSIYADDGKNNFIEFVKNSSRKRIRMLVSSKNYESLITLREVWKKNGVMC